MKFTKMHGCGNDYIYIEDITGEKYINRPQRLVEMAQSLSNRRKGIGADGIILITASKVADFGMEIINADGSIAEMCGNGIRCVGKYVYEHKLTKHKFITIETRAGIKELELMTLHGMVTSVKVNMGSPILDVYKMNLNYHGDLQRLIDIRIDAEGPKEITCVSMGNPHAVMFVGDTLRTDVKKIGSMIEHHSLFPQRTNVEFVQMLGSTELQMRVWERGSGETFACGTGACASVIAAIVHGYTKNKVMVHLLGGDLLIEYAPSQDIIYMTGPAVTVYEGETVEYVN